MKNSKVRELEELVTALEKSEGEDRERHLAAIPRLLSDLGAEIEASRMEYKSLLERVRAHLPASVRFALSAVEAFEPIRGLLRRFDDEVIPQIEQQREPSQRRAMVAGVEEDLTVVINVLGDFEHESRNTRRGCTGLLKIVKRLRPRRKPRPRPSDFPTEKQKEAILDALRKRRSMAMGELCYATGVGVAKLTRILKVLRADGRVERSGSTSGTRYRLAGKEAPDEEKLERPRS